MELLGERIERRRAELGMTPTTLAKLVGVSRQAVFMWEKGDTKGLKPENLVKCADALETTVRWLVLGKDDGVELRLAQLSPALRQHVLDELAAVEAVARKRTPIRRPGPTSPPTRRPRA